MLGAVDESYLQRLLEAIAAADAARVLSIADEMQSRSLSFDAALQDLARLLLRIATLQAIGASSQPADVPEAQAWSALAQSLDAEFVQLCYQIALQGREDLPLAPDEHAGFVMTVLRMLAFRPESAGVPVANAGEASKPAGPAASAPARASKRFDGDWPALVKSLPVGGAARELARNSALVAHANGALELAVPASMAHLAEQNYRDKLRVALEQHFGHPVVLKVSKGPAAGATVAEAEAREKEARKAEADRAVQGDQFVRDLVDIFDAKVVDSRARPMGGGN
jgi:DNA polymerase-3 subunit gamma/tau